MRMHKNRKILRSHKQTVCRDRRTYGGAVHHRFPKTTRRWFVPGQKRRRRLPQRRDYEEVGVEEPCLFLCTNIFSFFERRHPIPRRHMYPSVCLEIEATVCLPHRQVERRSTCSVCGCLYPGCCDCCSDCCSFCCGCCSRCCCVCPDCCCFCSDYCCSSRCCSGFCSVCCCSNCRDCCSGG